MPPRSGNSSGSSFSSSEIGILGLLGVLLLAMLSILWATASNKVGPVYAIVRDIESFSWLFDKLCKACAWKNSEWGAYFNLSNPKYGYTFTSIYRSSVVFNVISVFFVGLVGLFAYNKVNTRHLYRRMSSDNPPTYVDIMRKQGGRYPHCKFFLLFPMEEYSSVVGPARLPKTALELLRESGAIVGVYEPNFSGAQATEKTGWKIDQAALERKLIEPFGPVNPFAEREFNFEDRPAIEKAVGALPWHVVSIVYACVRRFYAQTILDSESDFKKEVGAVDEYFKDIWRELNKLKSAAPDTLFLGFSDEDDRAIKLAQAREKRGAKIERVYSLAEYLDEADPKKQQGSRGDNLPTTKKARAGLVDLLTDHLLPLDKRVVLSVRDKNGSPRKFSEKAFSDSERVRAKQFFTRHREVIEAIRRILTRNGYQFGLCATLLTDARRGGILPPNVFLWMRFYDNSMWSFLRVVGMNVPVPEVAGMFDHFLVEEKYGSPLRSPVLVSAPEAIRQEANKYLTRAARDEYGGDKLRETATDKARAVASSIDQRFNRV